MVLEPEHQVYRVVYDHAKPCWTIERDGTTRPVLQTDSRTEAVELAVKLGRSAQSGRVFVYRRNGSLETEHAFDDSVPHTRSFADPSERRARRATRRRAPARPDGLVAARKGL